MPVDVGHLRAAIQRVYSEVVADPKKPYHFLTGPTYAVERLGYPAADVGELPDSVTAPFAGVGAPLSLGAPERGDTVSGAPPKKQDPRAIRGEMRHFVIRAGSEHSLAAALQLLEPDAGSTVASRDEGHSAPIRGHAGRVIVTRERQAAESWRRHILLRPQPRHQRSSQNHAAERKQCGHQPLGSWRFHPCLRKSARS